jgi:hypothetical protein
VLKLLALNVLDRVTGNFLVVTLQSSQVFASLREFAFLHTLTNIPVDKGTLGVHEIKLVRERGPGLRDGSSVGEHAAVGLLAKALRIIYKYLHRAVDLSKIAVGNHLRRLVADANLEASRAPVDKLDGTLGLESSDSTVNVVGHDVTTVQQASSHVFAVAWIALDHLVVGLEARVGDLLNRVGLVLCLGRRDDRSISNQGEVNAGIWNQVGLELVQVDVEGTIESEGGGDGRDDWETVSFSFLVSTAITYLEQ